MNFKINFLTYIYNIELNTISTKISTSLQSRTTIATELIEQQYLKQYININLKIIAV